MLGSFRRMSKSKVGTFIMAAILLAIIAGFAMADLSNFGTGNVGFGMGGTTLAEVGGEKVTEPDMSDAMQRRLQQVREQAPETEYAAIAGDFEPLLSQMIDERALIAFARKYGFNVSKRLVDAQIADLPGVRGLNGQPTVQGYQAFLSSARLNDQQLRQSLTAELVARYMLVPLSSAARIPAGVATPYATMLLEEREGEAAVVPVTAFTAGLNPTDQDLQRYYAANRARYMVPEQRVVRFAKIGPEQVASIAATDQEIAAFYKANQATYAPSEQRTLTQVVVPDANTANAIAARAKGGATIAAAAAPAGANAAVSTLADQTREAYAGVAGATAAAAVFSAASGAVAGPFQSEFGWVVVKVDAVKAKGGKTLEAARAEIADKLTAEKRKLAIEDLVTKLQESLDGGSNFSEAAASAKLAIVTTPLVTADGTSRVEPGYKLPAEFAPALKAGFEIAANDPPELPALADKSGYVMVAPERIVPAAPAPLATVRERVKADWIAGQAMARARTAATAIAARAAAGASLADAIRQSGVSLPVRPLAARRIQIAQADAQVMPALRTLFSLLPGKSRMARDTQGRGFFVVKLNKVTPGNAFMARSIIPQLRSELQQTAADDYARQFVAALRKERKVERNETAIAAFKKRLLSGTN